MRLRRWCMVLCSSLTMLVTCEQSGDPGSCGVPVNPTCNSFCFVCLKARSYNGTYTNPAKPTLGAAGQPLRSWNITEAGYVYHGETSKNLVGKELPSAHEIATNVYLKARRFQNSLELNQMVPTWALFLYYDMVKLEDDDTEAFNINCSSKPHPLDQHCKSSDDVIPYYRAKATTRHGKRVAVNQATAYLDLSQVYGVSRDAALKLRTFQDGMLRLNDTTGLPIKQDDGTYLLADQRNAAHLGTLALTTLLMREHNRKAKELRKLIDNRTITECHVYGRDSNDCDKWDDDDYFEAARMWTIADYEHSTKEDFFPTILGEAPGAAWHLRGENEKPDVDPSIDPFFAAVGFRWMWSAMSPVIRLMDENWKPLPEYDPLDLRLTNDKDTMADVLERYGMDPVMRGLIATPAGEIDAATTSQLILYMAAAPVTDIQRARDLGVPDYNTMRRAYGLPEAATFSNVTSDATTQRLLSRTYFDLKKYGMDAITGALAEDLATSGIGITANTSDTYFFGEGSDALPSSDVLAAAEPQNDTTANTWPAIGPLLRAVVIDQFRRVYEGDKMWHIHNNTLETVDDETIGKLVARNGDYKNNVSTIMADMPSSVFRLPSMSPTCASSTFNTSDNNTVIFKANRYWMTWSQPESGEVKLTFNIVGMGAKGYFAFGLGLNMRDNADIMFCTYNSGGDTVVCEDRHASSNKMPVADTVIRGYSDNSPNSVEHTYKDGILTVTWTRKLDTGDPGDKKITIGNNNVIWSFNLVTPDQQHGFDDRGAVVIDFYNGTSDAVQSSPTKDFFALHGAIMLLAFGFTAPAAMITARYFKHYKQWMSIHEAFGVFTAQASIPIAAAAMASASRPRFSTRHGKLGLAMFFLIILQAATGYVRMLGIENRGNKLLGDNYGRFHWLNTRVHRVLGRCIIPLGLFQVYMGLWRISPAAKADFGFGSDFAGNDSAVTLNVSMFGPIRDYLFVVWLGILTVVFMWLEYGRLRRKFNVRSKLEQSARLPHYTQEKFDDCILQGCKWLIVNDEIFDMADYMKVHPGGSKIIKESIGMDVTAFIDGQRTVGKGVFNETVHRHTAAAYAAMRPNLVGYLQKHDFFAEDDNPDRALFTKSSSLTSSTAASESFSLQRGRGFGPRYATFEVVRRTAVPSAKIAAAAERPVYLFTLTAKERDYKADLLRAGWYFKFRAISHGTMVQRQFTPVASHMLNDGRIGYDFYIRLIPGGQMSEILREKKPALIHHRVGGDGREVASTSGSCIGVQGPFVIPELAETYGRIYMLAGGTGVAPMLQVVRRNVRAMTARRRAGTAPPPQAPSSPPPLLSLQLKPPSSPPPLLPLPLPYAPRHGAEASATLRVTNDHGTAYVDPLPEVQSEQSVSEDPSASSKPSVLRDGTAALPVPASKWGAARVRMRASRALAAGGGGRRRGSGLLHRAPSMSTVTGGGRFGPIMAENAHLEAIERRLLEEDGGITNSLLDFCPAATLGLLWQTHAATEGFCVADLCDLAAASRGAFKYVQYAAVADERDLRAAAKSQLKRRASLNRRLQLFAAESARRNLASASASPQPESIRGPRRRQSSNLSSSDDSGREWKDGGQSDSDSADCGGNGGGDEQDSGAGGGGGGDTGGVGLSWFRRRRRDSESSANDGLPVRGRRGSRAAGASAVHPSRRRSVPDAENLPAEGLVPDAAPLRGLPPLARTLTLPTNIASDGVQREAQEARRLGPASVAAAADEAAADKCRGPSSCSEGSGDERDLEGGPATEQLPSRRHHSSISSEGSNWQEEDTSEDSVSGGDSGGVSGESGSDGAGSRFRQGLRRGLVIGKVDVAAVEKLLAPLLIDLRTWELAAAAGQAEPPIEVENTVVMISGTAEFADAILAILKELRVPKKLIFCLD